jgi:hyperosmotically inducible protein
VIVSSGGFLGMGDELSVIPPAAFRFEPDHDALVLDASKETLSAAPHFKSSQWADLNDPSYTAGVYHAYHVEPYFNTNKLADNSARNVQDRDNRTLTPGDQGNSTSDVDTTRRIRKEVMSRQMSVAAHNVKIITVNGRVTLRGPVNTEEEKRAIGDIAGGIAQADNVDNQLEVKMAN